MAVKVKFVHDGMAAGAEVSVGDYFLAKNGEEVIVTDDTLQRYETEQGQTLEEALSNSDAWSVKHATKKEVEEAYPEIEDVPEDEPVEEEAPVAEPEEGGES